MTDILSLTSEQLMEAANLKKTIANMEARLASILGSNSKSSSTGARKMSAAGRARIAAAQKARWAKAKGKSAPKRGGKRKMSAAARARIAAAAKARWAKAKAAGKKSL